MSNVDLNTIKLPFVIKNKKLFVPGFHNGAPFKPSDIHSTFQLTKWSDSRITSIYLDHRDGITYDSYGNEKIYPADVRDYVGSIRNIHMAGDDLIGDLHIVDMQTAIKLAFDDTRFGISPKGGFLNGKPLIRNFAMVVDPAQGIDTEIGKNFAMSHNKEVETLTPQEFKQFELKMNIEDLREELHSLIDPVKEEMQAIQREVLALKEKDVKVNTEKPKEDVKDLTPNLEKKIADILAKKEADSKAVKELADLKAKVEQLEKEKVDREKTTINVDKPKADEDTQIDNKEDKEEGKDLETKDIKETPQPPKSDTIEKVDVKDDGKLPKESRTATNQGMAEFLQKVGGGI